MRNIVKANQPWPCRETGFFGWFNRRFDRMTDRYGVRVSKLTKRIGRVMLMFALLVGMLVYSFGKLPSAFLPEEDQGYFITSFYCLQMQPLNAPLRW